MSVLRFALRSLRRNPIYTGAAVVTLGLGIGANAIVYAFANAVFVRPLPFSAEDRLVWIAMTHRGPSGELVDNGGSEIDYVRFSERARTLASIGVMLNASYAVAREGGVESVDGAGVSASMWETLGTRPVAGRTFDRGEDEPLSSAVVISEALQRRLWPGPPERALAKQLIVDKRACVVIGVMPSASRR